MILAGCDDVGDDDTVIEDFTPVDDERTFRAVVPNSTVLNGIKLNGIKLNGIKLNGIKLNGIKLNGIKLNGIKLNGIKLNGTSLGLKSMSNVQIIAGSLLSAFDTVTHQTRVGAQLTNMIFDLGIEVGGGEVRRKLRIKGVTQSAVQSDVYFYELESQVGVHAWEPSCRDDAGNPVDAIALRKYWDPISGTRQEIADAITWACRDGALAKAVEWGYRPWATHDGQDLEDYHEAAVRMIRADYCGDGTPHTSDGNVIDVEDRLGLQVNDTTWPIEAKWGPDGAVCLNTPRKLYHPRATIPCAAALPTCSTSDPDEHGGLLMTRAVPNGV